MGIAFRGHSAYFKALTSILSFFDELSKFDTSKVRKKTILLGLHYINTTLCTSDNCRVCNHDLIQEYVRKSQKRALSCSTTPILLDSYELTNSYVANMNSRDGVHPSVQISRLQAQFILQALISETGNCTIFQTGTDCRGGVPELSMKDLEYLRYLAKSENEENSSRLPCLNRNKIDNLYATG